MAVGCTLLPDVVADIADDFAAADGVEDGGVVRATLAAGICRPVPLSKKTVPGGKLPVLT